MRQLPGAGGKAHDRALIVQIQRQKHDLPVFRFLFQKQSARKHPVASCAQLLYKTFPEPVIRSADDRRLLHTHASE